MALYYNPNKLPFYYGLEAANLAIYSVAAAALLFKVKDSLDCSPYFTILSFWLVYIFKFTEYTYLLISEPELGDVVYTAIYMMSCMSWCLVLLIMYCFVFEMESFIEMLNSNSMLENQIK